MSMLEDSILQAIDIITDKKISEAKYNKTVQGIIVSCVNQTIGKYRIKYQDSYWYAYSIDTNVSYSEGTSVYILIPNGNMNDIKIILGTTNGSGTSQNFNSNVFSIQSLNNSDGLADYTIIYTFDEHPGSTLTTKYIENYPPTQSSSYQVEQGDVIPILNTITAEDKDGNKLEVSYTEAVGDTPATWWIVDQVDSSQMPVTVTYKTASTFNILNFNTDFGEANFNSNVNVGGAFRCAIETGECIVDSAWQDYSSEDKPLLIKQGNVVNFSYRFKPKAAINLGNTTGQAVCTIPSGFRPSRQLGLIIQGPSAIFLLALINQEGVIKVARARTPGTSGFYTTNIEAGGIFLIHGSWITEEDAVGIITDSDSSSGGGGVKNYNDLINKPKIEGVTLIGDKTFEELNLNSITNSELEEIMV